MKMEWTALNLLCTLFCFNYAERATATKRRAPKTENSMSHSTCSRPQCCTEWMVSFRFYIVFFPQFQLKLCNHNRTILNYLKIQWLWYCNMNCSIQSVSRPHLWQLFVHVPDFMVHPKKHARYVRVFVEIEQWILVNILNDVLKAMKLVVKKAEKCSSETSEKAYCLNTA
jgi:hypothetical protein